MGDVLLEVLSGIKKRFRDMGDGTHAEVVAVSGFSGGGGSGENISITRAWSTNGLSATDTASKQGSLVTYTRTITVTTARNLSTWTSVSAWVASDGGAVPANLLSWNGDPLTLNGSYLTFSA